MKNDWIVSSIFNFSFDDEEEDEVRAPIPQKQEILVQDQYHGIKVFSYALSSN